MITSGTGSIVNISSMSATRGMAGVDAYTAAKAGMQGLTRSIAAGYGAQNIRCNTIVTGMIPHSAGGKGPFVPLLGAKQLVSRLGRAADIAYAALYFASDESTFVTGVELPVDGGVTSAIKIDVTETLRQAQQSNPERAEVHS
jgi:NAD(P)-dependent dehydrogenase (short-subunit alcohol dehydrogenase family)